MRGSIERPTTCATNRSGESRMPSGAGTQSSASACISSPETARRRAQAVQRHVRPERLAPRASSTCSAIQPLERPRERIHCHRSAAR